VLVTGASKGIGFGCVVALLKAGAHVIAVSKTIDEVELNHSLKAANVDPSKVTVIQADLADAAKVRNFALLRYFYFQSLYSLSVLRLPVRLFQ
jgi:NAD(P)-dependent dehydrogenase (short-subunit alcohol dehydrogenase family)